MNNKVQGIHKQSYVPSLQGANPVKKDNDEDWWNEMCKKHGEKNYFPTKKAKKDDSDK